MAILYADVSGNILVFFQSPAWGDQLPDTPDGTMSQLEFDPSSNPALVNAMNTNWNNCKLVGGQFLQGGVPIPINPNSQSFADKKLVAGIRQKLGADTKLTDPELITILRYILSHFS